MKPQTNVTRYLSGVYSFVVEKRTKRKNLLAGMLPVVGRKADVRGI